MQTIDEAVCVNERHVSKQTQNGMADMHQTHWILVLESSNISATQSAYGFGGAEQTPHTQTREQCMGRSVIL